MLEYEILHPYNEQIEEIFSQIVPCIAVEFSADCSQGLP
jgi:hypothetical protein